MAEELSCPRCGVINVASRVWCVACQSPLRQSTPSPFDSPKEEPKDKEAGAPSRRVRRAKEEQAAKKSVTSPATKKPTKEAKIEPAKETTKEEPPKKRARRKRAKKEVIATFFTLIAGKLQPVSVELVTRKIKPELEAKQLISLWNRTKRLLK